MSSISAAGIVDQSLRQASSSGTSDAFSELSSDEFIRIITTELTSQDPLQPSDTKALLEQINSIREIESDISLKKTIESLVTENQFATAGGLIGTRVTGRDSGFVAVEGLVTSVARRGDDMILGLENGSEINVNSVERIEAGTIG